MPLAFYIQYIRREGGCGVKEFFFAGISGPGKKVWMPSSDLLVVPQREAQ